MENREIKFRGLDARCIWHYGDLVQGSMHGCAIRIEIDIPPSMSDPGGDTRVEYYTVRPETIGQYTGLKGKNGVEIYEGSIAKFKAPIDKEAAFYNSNCGKIMIKNLIDELLIRFNTSEFLSLDYDIFFIKDGKPVTDLYWFEKCGDNYSDATVEELEKLNVPYTQSDSDINFIRYLIEKGMQVIGNVYQNSELLK